MQKQTLKQCFPIRQTERLLPTQNVPMDSGISVGDLFSVSKYKIDKPSLIRRSEPPAMQIASKSLISTLWFNFEIA